MRTYFQVRGLLQKIAEREQEIASLQHALSRAVFPNREQTAEARPEESSDLSDQLREVECDDGCKETRWRAADILDEQERRKNVERRERACFFAGWAAACTLGIEDAEEGWDQWTRK